MIDKLKKYIRSIAIAFLFTILVETAILCFTNNTMYGCPDNAISIMDVIKAEEDTSNKVIEEKSIPIILDEACIRTLYLQFYLGSFIKNILIYDNEGNLICENRNVDGSLHSLMILPKYNNQFTIQIIGKGKIKDILCSELDPKIEKKFVYNPLRMIMLFAFILWLCIEKSFISSKYKYTLGKAPEIIKLIIPGGIYVCVLSTICRMLVISQYKRIFFIMMGLCLITIIQYFIRHIRNIESLYLIISLIFTASTIMINPVFVYGGDSYTHFMRALNVAQEYEECDYLAYHSVMQEDGSIEIEAMDEAREIANEEPVYSNTSFKPLFIRNIRYVAYLIFASGLVIGDALNLSTYSAFLLGGIFNAWFVCTLFYIGMRQLKGGKLVLAVFSLLPYIVMNTCRWSYTPQIIGWITVFSAYIIGQKQIKGKIAFGKRDRQIFIFSVIGLLPKAPYMLTFLLNEINTPQKFKSRKDYWMNRIAMYGSVLFLFFTLLLPIINSSNGIGVYSDKRGGTGVDALGQAVYILRNPIWYIKVLTQNIIELFSPKSVIFGKLGILSFGAASKYAQAICPHLLMFLFIVVILTDYRKRGYLELRDRIIIVMITVVNVVFICTLMYMNYSEVGAEIMQGINPLYLVTFMFPLLYCLGISDLFEKVKMKCRYYNTAILGSWMLLLYGSVYQNIVMKYC